ncbi:hypothetical protein CSIV_01520 [Microbacterium sp. CSI-V]|uniref:sialate O-acetylesterase n=2 Tax=unclassified Microbacterium TaxID=2609290 RepID=UPI00097C5D64|nr:sialate O-acetylesterase [Microbacterium sp. CSI-V]ONI66327.1 hypothetical protein CSIV_01520 [Microbacterium sp. CSI-V]
MTMEGWILAGQSNMEGSAPLDDPATDRVDDTRVMSFTSAGEWEVAREPLHRTWESYTPVHSILHRRNPHSGAEGITDAEMAERERRTQFRGAGLGLAFGKARADATGGRVALVPAAHGGTSLNQWMPGSEGEERSSPRTLYGSLLDRVARARTRPDFVLRGVLWYQGESDANPSDSPTYARRWADWIAAVRDDLDAPDLEVLAVQIGRFVGTVSAPSQTERDWDRVREAQRLVAQRTEGVRCTSAIDLGLCDDVHVDASGSTRLGIRLATMVDAPEAGPDVSRVEVSTPRIDGYVRLRVVTTGVTGAWTAGPLPGFRLTDAEGQGIPGIDVVDAHRDPRRPSDIEILCTPFPREPREFHVSYGLGYDPVCRAVDDRDLPLPTFGSQPVRGVDHLR